MVDVVPSWFKATPNQTKSCHLCIIPASSRASWGMAPRSSLANTRPKAKTGVVAPGSLNRLPPNGGEDEEVIGPEQQAPTGNLPIPGDCRPWTSLEALVQRRQHPGNRVVPELHAPVSTSPPLQRLPSSPHVAGAQRGPGAHHLAQNGSHVARRGPSLFELGGQDERVESIPKSAKLGRRRHQFRENPPGLLAQDRWAVKKRWVSCGAASLSWPHLQPSWPGRKTLPGRPRRRGAVDETARFGRPLWVRCRRRL